MLSDYKKLCKKERAAWLQNIDWVRGFALIGMLEYWNDGIVGFGKLEKWVIDKIHLDNDLDNEGRIFI
ncbi:MAG: hypothetical protein JRD02_03370 [Deltaproteobacteria bacterium]|nr:hypothetical protein [Deltaproteobacteria bacterium]